MIVSALETLLLAKANSSTRPNCCEVGLDKSIRLHHTLTHSVRLSLSKVSRVSWSKSVLTLSGSLFRQSSTNSRKCLLKSLDSVGGLFLGMRNSALIGWRSELGGSPLASSIAVMPRLQMSTCSVTPSTDYQLVAGFCCAPLLLGNKSHVLSVIGRCKARVVTPLCNNLWQMCSLVA